MSVLAELTSLKAIELWRINKLSDISFLEKLTNLEIIKLQDLKHVTCLPDLGKCGNLQRIFLIGTGVDTKELPDYLREKVSDWDNTGVLVQGKQTTPNHKVKVRQAVEEKDWIRVENAHAPLIDSCLFESVQTLLGRDTRTSPKADAVYECGRHKNLYDYSCPQKSIHKKDLDRSVEEAIRYHIQLFRHCRAE